MDLEQRVPRAAVFSLRARAAGIVIIFLFGVLAPIGLAPSAAQASEHCSSNTLERNDDGSTGPVNLGFTIDFFGTDYSALYVNNNGNVTFTGALSDFTPTPIVGAGIPIIAPFWADVDTRAEGSAEVTYGQTMVGGRNAFCVAWDGVGYYNTHDDKLNEFELLLINRSDVALGDFDIVFDYSQVQWETGDSSGGDGGFGGTSARAGYSNGSSETPETSFELPGSAVNGALLDSNTETGLIHNSRGSEVDDGTYIFPVRNGEPPQPQADLAVTQTDDPDPVASGGQITYEITVTNNGPDVATSVTLDDTLPDGASFGSALSESGECGGSEGVVSCDLGSLEPEATAMVSLVVDAPEVEVTTVITNSATASADQADPVETNDTSDEETTVEAAEEAMADLAVTQADEPDPVTAGNGVEYVVTVTNSGPVTATDVTLVDTIPEGSTLITADDGCSAESETVVCDLGTLGPEGSAAVSIVVRAPTVSTATTMTNSATATAAEVDPNPADNTSDEVTTIQPAPSDPNVATGFVSSEGGTVATGAGKGPTKKDPMTTAVTVPPGFPGVVTIVEGPITSCATGFVCFGQEANITAPDATVDKPLKLTFTFHASTVKTGNLASIVMFHGNDNILVPRCTGLAGVAQPDPCIASVSKVKGNVQVVVFSSENGTWRGGR